MTNNLLKMINCSIIYSFHNLLKSVIVLHEKMQEKQHVCSNEILIAH